MSFLTALNLQKLNGIKKAIILCVLVLTLTSSCSSNNKTQSEKFPRKPTSKEAQLFSKIFVNTFEAKNAKYLASAGTLPAKGFIARGVADWENNIFSLDVSLTKDKDVDIKSIATDTGTFETYVEIETGYRDNQLEAKSWVFRKFNPESFGIDALAKALSVLANETPENPLLLAQNGVKVLGTETVNNVDTTVFQGIDSRKYFVSEEGKVIKIIGALGGFKQEITIQFYDYSNANIEIPKPDTFYEEQKVQDWYFQLRPSF